MLLWGWDTKRATGRGCLDDQQIAGLGQAGEPTYCPHFMPYTVEIGLGASEREMINMEG